MLARRDRFAPGRRTPAQGELDTLRREAKRGNLKLIELSARRLGITRREALKQLEIALPRFIVAGRVRRECRATRNGRAPRYEVRAPAAKK